MLPLIDYLTKMLINHYRSLYIIDLCRHTFLNFKTIYIKFKKII